MVLHFKAFGPGLVSKTLHPFRVKKKNASFDYFDKLMKLREVIEISFCLQVTFCLISPHAGLYVVRLDRGLLQVQAVPVLLPDVAYS